MNSNKQIAVYDNTVTARTYLSYIAEQAGGFAYIGRDNKLYIKTISNTVAEVVPFRLFQKYSWGEDFKVSRVAYEDGTRDFKFGDTAYHTVWINQDNMYIVDEEQVQNIYRSCEDFTCWSFEGTSIINPALDLGDVIEIDGRRVVYQGKIEYKGKFKADISSNIQAKSKEDSMVTKTSTANKIRRVQSSIDQMKGEIENLVTEVDDNSEKMSQVLQTVDSIIQKVENIADLTNTVKGIKTITITDAIAGAPVELRIFGNNTVFQSLILSDDLLLEDSTVLNGDSDIAINDVVYDLGIDEVLRQCEGVYDEYVFDYTNKTAKVIRRIGVRNNRLYVLAKEIVEDLPVPNFAFSEGTNRVTIPSYSANFQIKYVIKNDYTNMFATRVEMKSNISQTAEEIKSEVGKNIATAKGELEESISSVSQTAEQIQHIVKKNSNDISKVTQTANSISQEVRQKVDNSEIIASLNLAVKDKQGIVELIGNIVKIVSDNFTLDENGVITAKAGTIGGFNITKNALSSNNAGFTSNELVAFWAGTSANDMYAGHHPFEATWNGAVYALNGVYTWMNNHHVPVISTLADNFDGIGVEVQRIFRNQDTYTFTFAIANSGTWSIQMSPPSDKKLKDNIEDTNVKGLDVVNQIQFRQFDWNDEYKKLGFVNFERHEDFGIVADELEKINQKFVTENKQEDGEIIKTVNREELIYYNSKSIQELSEENRELKKQLEGQQGQIDLILSRLEEKDE